MLAEVYQEISCPPLLKYCVHRFLSAMHQAICSMRCKKDIIKFSNNNQLTTV